MWLMEWIKMVINNFHLLPQRGSVPFGHWVGGTQWSRISLPTLSLIVFAYGAGVNEPSE